MRVILLQDIKGIGKKFEEKSVADGYAMNFLIPKRLALVADLAGIVKAKQFKEQSEKKRILEEARLKEKEAEREKKHRELEEFRRTQREPSS